MDVIVFVLVYKFLGCINSSNS